MKLAVFFVRAKAFNDEPLWADVVAGTMVLMLTATGVGVVDDDGVMVNVAVLTVIVVAASCCWIQKAKSKRQVANMNRRKGRCPDCI